MSRADLSRIGELGVQSCLYLGALLTAQQRRMQVAPTLRSTLIVLAQLRDSGIIQVPWPDSRWGIRPDARITPIEDLQWAFNWSVHKPFEVLAELEGLLEKISRNEWNACALQHLWEDLMQWEIEHFFEHQLTRHHFDAAWVGDFGFVLRHPRWKLPVARWRYCCWAAVRHGAAMAQQHKIVDPARIRKAIFDELQRRISYAATMKAENGMLLPFDAAPSSALSELFISRISKRPDRYWTAYRFPSDGRRQAQP